VAEGGGLLNRYTVNSRIVGSNPIPSATTLGFPRLLQPRSDPACDVPANRRRSKREPGGDLAFAHAVREERPQALPQRIPPLAVWGWRL
jgi:hypothetical protein